MELMLDEAQSDFDRLMAEVRDGVRSAAHFDQLEAEGERIRSKMRDAFRRGLR